MPDRPARCRLTIEQFASSRRATTTKSRAQICRSALADTLGIGHSGRVTHAEFKVHPTWHRTGNNYFPAVARVDGSWWVLRLNSFPDHPVWTLFVDGARRFDVDDTPFTWGKPLAADAPKMNDADIDSALDPVRTFLAYGSEVGRPCDNPFCCG